MIYLGIFILGLYGEKYLDIENKPLSNEKYDLGIFARSSNELHDMAPFFTDSLVSVG